MTVDGDFILTSSILDRALFKPTALAFAMTGLVAATGNLVHAQEVTPPQLSEPDFSADPPSEAPSEPAPEMLEALERIEAVVEALDSEAERNGNNWQFTLDDRMILIVTDVAAGRMRILTPIAEAAALPEGASERLLQANFDTALDARYAIANGLVWGTFLHPLDTLTTRDFASGVLQTKSVADTFGTTFSSGVLNYGGGDSGAIIEEQVEQLLKELEQRSTA